MVHSHFPPAYVQSKCLDLDLGSPKTVLAAKALSGGWKTVWRIGSGVTIGWCAIKGGQKRLRRRHPYVGCNLPTPFKCMVLAEGMDGQVGLDGGQERESRAESAVHLMRNKSRRFRGRRIQKGSTGREHLTFFSSSSPETAPLKSAACPPTCRQSPSNRRRLASCGCCLPYKRQAQCNGYRSFFFSPFLIKVAPARGGVCGDTAGCRTIAPQGRDLHTERSNFFGGGVGLSVTQ